MDSDEFKEKTRKHYIESLETTLAEQKAIIRELTGKTITGKRRKVRQTPYDFSFWAGMAVGMIAFATFFLALVLLDKI